MGQNTLQIKMDLEASNCIQVDLFGEKTKFFECDNTTLVKDLLQMMDKDLLKVSESELDGFRSRIFFIHNK